MTFLGIDGGGSKTTFLLEDNDGRELARFDTGPSNWLSSGPATTRDSLVAGIASLPVKPDAVCAGFAGAGRPEALAFYRARLSELLPQARLFIETDAFITYIGAIGIQPGVLLIAGTGSIALSRKPDGTMVRAGGWGPTFSDDGSGFWIGREAIREALRAHDSGTSSEFISAVSGMLGLEKITDAPMAWKTGTVDVRSVAALALWITRQYPSEPAARILRGAATHLRSLMETARERAGLPESCHRSVSGSIATNTLLQQLIELPLLPPANPPARGAILWARDRILGS